MRNSVINKVVISFSFLFLIAIPATHSRAASPSVRQAKKAAASKGYIFFVTHDEIVAGAKKEGQLRVMTGLNPPNFRPLIDRFKQKYPFISDIGIAEISGKASNQRIILEIKAGQDIGWDVTPIYLDLAPEYVPYLMKHDILGMAEHGVLNIDSRMIHPLERNMVSAQSSLTVVPYNRKLISEDKVPSKWEDFLRPEFQGRKFVLDIRPVQVAGLVPAWGLKRTLEFCRKLAAQDPVWGRGATRMTTAVAAGEYAFYLGSNLGSIHRVMKRDPTGNLSYKIIEPSPVRVVNGAAGILKSAAHPHAALLWFEFLASPKGQEIVDQYEPLRGSVFSSGSAIAQATQGKKLSVVDWGHFTRFQQYEAKIVEAWGFPKVDKRK